ncbi:tail fiber domain-containing protein [Flavobacterium sp. LB3P21]|uniref:tail fiber domain-containing protein n=1 Tax=Flavobacterium sp. LB3P21 TaxID=3401719 RepID=UPI003AABEACC
MAIKKFLVDISVNGKILVDTVPNNSGTILTISSIDGKTISTRTNTEIKTDLALGNLNNTSDLNKPVSTATQTALNLKSNLASPTFTGTVTAPTFSGTLNGSSNGASRRIEFTDGPRTLADRLPNTFPRSVNFDFVGSGIVGGTGNYAGVMTFTPWDGTAASTGDSSYQLGFNNESGVNGSGAPGLKLRKGIDSAWGAWTTILSSANFNSYSPTLAGGGATGTWGINITGNATNLSTTRSTWNTNGTISAVVGQLAWKNYGNNHTIFDGSAGSAPDGTVVNNANSQVAWTGSYPTLMGWNGANTYGVRVDSSRVADYANSAGSAPANGGTSAAVTINYNNDSNSTYQMLWGSGNGVYGTAGIYCNPSTDAIYAAAIYSTSDIRYKDITEKQYQNVEELEAISYTWKDKTKGEKIQVGYSAQEVQKYIPDAVNEDENGYLSVNYVQVLIAKIESLEKRINQLENGLE